MNYGYEEQPMCAEEVAKAIKSTKHYKLQENSKSFKQRKHEMHLADAAKRKAARLYRESRWQAE